MHSNLNTSQVQNWVVVENGTVISKFLHLFYYGFRKNVYISELKIISITLREILIVEKKI